MRRLGSFLTAAVLLFLAGDALGQDQAPAQVTLTVDLSKPGPAIDRHIYGQFAEHLGRGIYEGIWVGEGSKIPNIHGYRKDVVEALRRIHVPVIRWPGGCFGDLYDWRDGIGPRAKRPVRINVHWGGVTEDNSFGTHEFLDFTELVGADAYVSGNVGSLTPYDMAQWIEYMTSSENSTLANERRKNGRAKPWNIKYFGVGNEIWGCGGNMNADYASDVSKRYATFVFPPPGQQMIKVISGPNGPNPNVFNDTDTMMKNIRNMQMLSIHQYTFPHSRPASQAPGTPYVRGPATGFDESEWAITLSKAQTMEPLLSGLTRVMDKEDPDHKVTLAIDEWGSWYDQEPGSHPGFLYQQNTLRDAEVAALTLDIFHRHTDRVKMSNIAQMINVLQAMILTDKDKMLLTPTYHVYDMYQPFMGAVPYPATLSGPRYTASGTDQPMVDASVARGTDGKLYLALVNLDPHRPAHIVTSLSGSAHGRILTGPAMDTRNTFDAPNTIHPVAYSGANEGGKLVFDLPSKSVAVVAVE
jgi:alpha-N-arabinofuranosidase